MITPAAITGETDEPRITFVSFADAAYFPLLYELVISIRQQRDAREYAISILDAGMTEEQRALLAPHIQQSVPPDWDLQNLPAYKKHKQHQKAFTCLPFLQRYFPDYDIYIWLDADCWVADWSAIDLLVAGAMQGKLAICPTVDRAYKPMQFIKWAWLWPYRIKSFLYKHSRRAFGRKLAREMALYPELNTGVFALHRDAPHWEAWANWMERAAPRARVYGIDQLTVALMIYRNQLPVALLPAWCNWLCVHALPLVEHNTGQLLEPHLPHHPIGIMHLSGLDAARTHPELEVELELSNGGKTRRPLRYELPATAGKAEAVSAFN